MKRALLIISFAIISLSSWAQDKICYIPKDLDPSFLYIQKYMPEYYYEGQVVDGNPKLFATSERLTVKVRVMHNYVDDKTCSYLILKEPKVGEFQTLFPDEIDSMISYLERVIKVMEQRPKNNNYYVYNSRTGIFFKTEWVQSSPAFGPYYNLLVLFPKGSQVKFLNKKEISNFIYQLKAAKELLPPAETDFLYDIKKELKDNLEVRDVDEVEYKES